MKQILEFIKGAGKYYVGFLVVLIIFIAGNEGAVVTMAHTYNGTLPSPLEIHPLMLSAFENTTRESFHIQLLLQLCIFQQQSVVFLEVTVQPFIMLILLMLQLV